MLQWSKEEDEVLAQVMTISSSIAATRLTLVRRPSRSMVRNGTKCKRLCHNGDITKSANDG